MTASIVQTTSGPIRGELDDGVHAFLGVPYGGPTGGAQRFRPPTLPEPWSSVRDATAFGPSCPQPASRPYGWTIEDAEGEGCLVLNVWSGGLHGGGYAIGSGSWPTYHGANLARRGDAVVVTVNHRLGALGYLHLGELAG